MIVLVTRSRAYMTQATGWLLAENADFLWQVGEEPGTWGLDIPVSSSEAISETLSEMLWDDQRPKRAPMPPWVPLFLQPAFAFSLCMSVLFCLLFYYVGGYSLRTEAFEMGLFSRQAVEAGQWWRFITGATLHADWAHVLGNGAFIMVLGWAVGERVGIGVTACTWLITAVCGFCISLVFSDVMISVGASGGLFGLLGLSGGHGYRNSKQEVLWFRRIREIGAAFSLLAFTAFSAKANISAHLGGFGAGVLLGLFCPREIPRWPVQWGALLTTTTIIFAAWYWAFWKLKGFSF